MKYIKTYENIKYFYNPPIIGGYYLVLHAHDYYKAQLINILESPDRSDKYLFDIFLDNLDKEYFYTDKLSYCSIERELFPNEIEIYNMKKDANKYNL